MCLLKIRSPWENKRFNIFSQIVKQNSSGYTLSTHNGVSVVEETFNYPVEIDFVLLPPGDITGCMHQSLYISEEPNLTGLIVY